MSMTYYKSETLDGWMAEGLVDNQNDRVYPIDGTKFFVRDSQIEVWKNEPPKSAFVLFYDAEGMRLMPILAMSNSEPENTSDEYVKKELDSFFAYAKMLGIADMEEDELRQILKLTKQLDGVQYKECEPCDSEGHIVEGVIDFEGKEVFVHSCFENPLTFEAECAISIIENEGGNNENK